MGSRQHGHGLVLWENVSWATQQVYFFTVPEQAAINIPNKHVLVPGYDIIMQSVRKRALNNSETEVYTKFSLNKGFKIQNTLDREQTLLVRQSVVHYLPVSRTPMDGSVALHWSHL